MHGSEKINTMHFFVGNTELPGLEQTVFENFVAKAMIKSYNISRKIFILCVLQ